MARRRRADALPEHHVYRDEGCEVAPACLSCPLAVCRYDVPGGLRAIRNFDRDRQIVEARRQGLPPDHLAQQFGVSRRTVFRVMERAA